MTETKYIIFELQNENGEKINILNGGSICLGNWIPGIAPIKGGGQYQDNPLAEMRRLIHRERTTAVEDIPLLISGDGSVEAIQELQLFLEQANNYWLPKKSGGALSWIKIQSNWESSPRYAEIRSSKIEGYPDLFKEGWNKNQALDTYNVIIERGHWQDNKPGDGECLQINSLFNWDFRDQFAILGSITAINSFDRCVAQSPITGTIIAGIPGGISRSTDNGITWVNNTAAPLNDVRTIIALSNGYFVGSQSNPGQNWVYSTDDGVTWNTSAVAAGGNTEAEIIVASTGNLFGLWTSGLIYRSTDNGVTWVAQLTDIPDNRLDINRGICFEDIAGNKTSLMAFCMYQALYVSEDDGAVGNWEQVQNNLFDDQLCEIYQHTDGYIFLSVGNKLLKSAGKYPTQISDLENWSEIFSANYNIIQIIIDAEEYMCLLATDGSGNYEIWISKDDGNTWKQERSVAEPAYWEIMIANGRVLVGEKDTAGGQVDVYRTFYRSGWPIEMGRDNTCEREIALANKFTPTNFTRIFNFDASGPTYTPILPALIFPQTLFPTTFPVVGDMMYWGIETDLTDTLNGPFDNIIFDLDPILRPLTKGSNFQVEWEYWNGVAWTTVPDLKDQTSLNYNNPPYDSFERGGVCGVFWEKPSDWSTTTVNGVPGWWIRARVTTITNGAVVGNDNVRRLNQLNRQMYTAMIPSITIDSNEISGDLMALAKVQLENMADRDSDRTGDAPDAFDNRIILGTRNVDRGDRFEAYLNIADRQTRPGIDLSLGANVSYIDDISAPIGRCAQADLTNARANFTDVISFEFDEDIFRDFYGVFRAFLVTEVNFADLDDVEYRLKSQSGSGGIVDYSEIKFAEDLTASKQVIDFGRLELPTSGETSIDLLSDQLEIAVQLRHDALPGETAEFFYLVLIPVDQYSIDAIDANNIDESIIGDLELLNIDSIENPRIDVRTIAEKITGSSTKIYSVWQPVSRGKFVLQPEKEQKIWVFAMNTIVANDGPIWQTNPISVHFVEMDKVERYLSLNKD